MGCIIRERVREDGEKRIFTIGGIAMRKIKIAFALALMLTATTTSVSVSSVNVLSQEETGGKESAGSVEYSTQNVLKLNEETLV